MRYAFAVLAVLTIFLFAGTTVRAQTPGQPATCADWFAVQSWTGTITYSGSGSGSDQHGNSQTISETARIDFTTAKNPSPCDVNGDFSSVIWIARIVRGAPQQQRQLAAAAIDAGLGAAGDPLTTAPGVAMASSAVAGSGATATPLPWYPV